MNDTIKIRLEILEKLSQMVAAGESKFLKYFSERDAEFLVRLSAMLADMRPDKPADEIACEVSMLAKVLDDWVVAEACKLKSE
jgi:hypothetical protein